MRKLKTLLTTAIALFVALAMVTPAFATGTHNVVITSQDSASHTYAAYQVFTGKFTGGALTDVGWGSNIDPTTFVTKLKAKFTGSTDIQALTPGTNGYDAAAVAEALSNLNKDDTTVAQDLATVISESLKSGATGKFSEKTGDKQFTIKDLEDGYYFVKDTEEVKNGTPTRFVIGAIGAEATIPVEAKNSDVPTIEKKVQDKNDSTGVTSEPQDSADYDIGDKVPFTLTGTVPAGATNYTEYYYAIQDVMSKGLTLDEGSVVVKANGTTLTKGTDYTLEINPTLDDTAYPDANNNTSFQVVLKDAKAHAGQTITVEYKATLNDQAAVGKVGNPNKARIEYSNNPNTNDHGKTEWDHVIVFTYKTIVNKVKEDNTTSLPGAAFTLYKKYADNATLPEGATAVTMKDKNGQDAKYVAVKTYVAGTATSFEFNGLDDGEYKLVETKAPDGYNSIQPIDFSISAEHVDVFTGLDWTSGKSGDNQILTSVDMGTFATVDDGTGTAKVVNKNGFELPHTGDMGTTILYVAGGLLALGAAIVLVSKRIAKSQN